MVNGLNRASAALAVALTLGFGLAPSSASADPAYFNGSSCVDAWTAISDPGCTAPGSPCPETDRPSTCRQFPGGSTPFSICVPDNVALFCCGGFGDCPYRTGSGASGTLECTHGTGIAGDAGICLDPSRNYCTAIVPPPASSIRSCHFGPGGAMVPYDEGDCDRDGLTNAEEEEAGTDPCSVPARRAVWDGSESCEPLPSGCIRGDTCPTASGPGTCRRSADGFGTICVPDTDGVLYCGGGAYECPEGQVEVVDSARRRTWCIRDVCGDEMGDVPIACVIDAEENPVGWGDGDCDEDGIPNMAESSEGICVPDDPPDEDAGGTSGDAGSPPDTDPEFAGGGGCACRAGESPSRSHGWLALLALGALLFRRRG